MALELTQELVVFTALFAANAVFVVKRPEKVTRWIGKKRRKALAFLHRNLDMAHARAMAVYFVSILVMVASQTKIFAVIG